MRTYSLAALILGTICTGLLSAFLLFAVLTAVPEHLGIEATPVQSEMNWANKHLAGTFWYWSVVVVAAKSILITIGAMVCRIRFRHHLTYKFLLAVSAAFALQLGLDVFGPDAISSAFANARASAGPILSEAGWQSPDQDRVCLAGVALVSLIYAIALSIQVGHDNRGTICT